MRMVEKVARIISVYSMDDPDDMTNAYPGGPLYPQWKEYEAVAKDILAAMREPTDGMVDAPYDADIDFGPGGTGDVQANPRNVWRAMIDKAIQEGGE